MNHQSGSNQPFVRTVSSGRCPRMGFSLIEALIALAILALIFTSIASAIGAGTATAGETRTRVVATLSADELLAEVLSDDWDGLLQWDGFEEISGEGRAPDGRLEPARKSLARSVEVLEQTRTLEPVGIEVDGRLIVIEVRDQNHRLLSRLERFVPGWTGGSS